MLRLILLIVALQNFCTVQSILLSKYFVITSITSINPKHYYDSNFKEKNEKSIDKILFLETEIGDFKLCLYEDNKIYSNREISKSYIYEGYLCDDIHTKVSGVSMNNSFIGEIKFRNNSVLYFDDPTKFGQVVNKCPKCEIILYWDLDIIRDGNNYLTVNSASSNYDFTKIGKKYSLGFQKSDDLKIAHSDKIYCELSLLLHDDFITLFGSFSQALSQISIYIHTLNNLLSENFKDTESKSILQYHIKTALRFGTGFELTEYIGNPSLLLGKTSEYADKFDSCSTGVYVNENWNGILGTAYVGTSSGIGICNSHSAFVVTGNFYGQSVLNMILQRTTLHEIGHNLGSSHDPEANCTKCTREMLNDCSEIKDFIMSSSSGTTSSENSYKFSPCSISTIKELIGLESRRSCLKASVSGLCGNGIVEDGEECDSGEETDKCCGDTKSTTPCKRNGQCSPSEGKCCDGTTCNFTQSSYRCNNETDCANASFCNGTSAFCDLPIAINEGELCNDDRAICFKGICSKSPCTKFNKTECLCGSSNACKICCNASNGKNGSVCLPHSYESENNKTILKNLSGGHTCHAKRGFGICNKQGNCKAISRISPIIGMIKYLMSGEYRSHLNTFFNDSFEFIIILLSLFICVYSGISLKNIDLGLSRYFVIDHEKILKNRMLYHQGKQMKKLF